VSYGAPPGTSRLSRLTFDQRRQLRRYLQVYFSVAHNPTERDAKARMWDAVPPRDLQKDDAKRRIAESYVAQPTRLASSTAR